MKAILHIESLRPVACIAALTVACFCALFVSSRIFVNPQAPKWVAAMEKSRKTAGRSAMCPARFIPLCETAGRHVDVLTIARQIIHKKIKIPSATVTAIKNEMQQLLEREGIRDSATQGGTSDKLSNNEPRQGETPEVSPRGSALPP